MCSSTSRRDEGVSGRPGAVDLHQQALAQVARRDAGRVEPLDGAEHALDASGSSAPHWRAISSTVDAQEPALVDVADDPSSDLQLGLVELTDLELPLEMLGEAGPDARRSPRATAGRRPRRPRECSRPVCGWLSRYCSHSMSAIFSASLGAASSAGASGEKSSLASGFVDRRGRVGDRARPAPRRPPLQPRPRRTHRRPERRRGRSGPSGIASSRSAWVSSSTTPTPRGRGSPGALVGPSVHEFRAD